MYNHDTVVIGGSAGSFSVLRRLVRDLPPDLPATIFICTHKPAHLPTYQAELLGADSALQVSQPTDGQPVEQGHIYLAPPDRHLLVIDRTIRLGHGPRENMVRPAIDPLFRSAALWSGSRSIGVILSGMLNDGAAGMHAISQSGGLTVVQHPADAEAPGMPSAALEAVDVDHVARGDRIGALLTELVASPAHPGNPASADLDLEIEIALGRRLGSERLRRIADPSPLSCPHCQGVLSTIRKGGPLRYRCQVGHGFTAEALLEAQVTPLHEALTISMRMMEERLSVAESMARDAQAHGRSTLAEFYTTRMAEYRRYADALREAVSASLTSSVVE
jgi:two-component system chemotaxis response regulator CheB